MIIAKIILLFTLTGITLQDIKERYVSLWLLVLVSGLMGFLHFQNSFEMVFLTSIMVNLLVISIIYVVLFFYSKLKLKKTINETFGLGDLLFFTALGIAFPTGTFLVLFSFSLIFSLALFLVTKSSLKIKTVPLAGLQALFLSFIYLSNWIFNYTNLYEV